jgi:putative sigma-54 modulation protein
MDRLTRHFDHVIDVNVILSVEREQRKAEASVHLRGRDLFAECQDPDMSVAIDGLVDKLDRQIVKHKEKLTERRTEAGSERAATVASTSPPQQRG